MPTPIHAMTAEEILAGLEEQLAEIEEFQGACFEQMEEYSALADARLSAFASDKLWVLAIEAVMYHDKTEEFSLDIWLYGNCLRERDFEQSADLSRPVFVVPPLLNRDEYPFRRDGFSIRWRGNEHPFAPSDEELQAAGIYLSKREQESGELSSIQVLRFLCHDLDHPFFASEDTLRDLMDKCAFEREWKYDKKESHPYGYVETGLGIFDQFPVLSCDLRLALQTRDWRHPRVGTLPEETISVREAFEPLTHTLATGDLSFWDNQDPARFNSHWSHWAETERGAEEAWQQMQVMLQEEGHRFRELLATLSPTEQEETLQTLKQQWQEWQHEVAALAHDLPYDSHQPISLIEVEGQSFTFGPHLWGEREVEEYPYPGAVSSYRPELTEPD